MFECECLKLCIIVNWSLDSRWLCEKLDVLLLECDGKFSGLKTWRAAAKNSRSRANSDSCIQFNSESAISSLSVPDNLKTKLFTGFIKSILYKHSCVYYKTFRGGYRGGGGFCPSSTPWDMERKGEKRWNSQYLALFSYNFYWGCIFLLKLMKNVV